MTEGIQKPNCETCTKRGTACKRIDPYPTVGQGYQISIINDVGCLSHPGAREYLMQDVIQELERRANMFGGEYGVAYTAAIALIRGGVK